MVEFNLHRLKPGRSPLPIDATLAWDGAATCSVSGELAIDNMDQKVLVSGEFEARREMPCHRCDRPCAQAYQAEIEVLILRNPGRGEPLTTSEDSWVIEQAGGDVELDDALREAVVLHEPQQILCREDCQGLCARCGVDLNDDSCSCGPEPIDPRWEALKKLREESAE